MCVTGGGGGALVCLFISITSKYLSRFSVVLFACCGTPLLEILSLCVIYFSFLTSVNLLMANL